MRLEQIARWDAAGRPDVHIHVTVSKDPETGEQVTEPTGHTTPGARMQEHLASKVFEGHVGEAALTAYKAQSKKWASRATLFKGVSGKAQTSAPPAPAATPADVDAIAARVTALVLEALKA